MVVVDDLKIEMEVASKSEPKDNVRGQARRSRALPVASLNDNITSTAGTCKLAFVVF